MNLALIQLPHFYGNGGSRPPGQYPLGLGYISNVLTENNIQHEAVDLWMEQLSVEDAVNTIDFSRFTVLGISAYITQYKYLKLFTLALKKKYPAIPIVCGGPGPTFSAELILKKTGVDICVIGEGELTLVDLLNNISSLRQVNGIVFKENNEIITTSPREYIEDLDTLQFPNRSLLNLEKYMASFVGPEMDNNESTDIPKWRSGEIIAGRGCPYTCFYCSKTFSGFRKRSVENVMEEVHMLIREYNINHLQFNDELFLISKKRVLEFCDELKKTGLKWSCQGRINMVDEEILSAMKEAGCVEIGYGVEAISQSLLDRMNKRIKSTQIIPAIKLTQKIGIKPLVQYMFGYPGENENTLRETVKFFRAIRQVYHGFTTTPIPGTELYKDCLNRGIITDEEDYVLRLDSGYNVHGALINMTDFSDEEFYKKKIWLRNRIDFYYYIRRPSRYWYYLLEYYIRPNLGPVLGPVKRKLIHYLRSA